MKKIGKFASGAYYVAGRLLTLIVLLPIMNKYLVRREFFSEFSETEIIMKIYTMTGGHYQLSTFALLTGKQFLLSNFLHFFFQFQGATLIFSNSRKKEKGSLKNPVWVKIQRF